MLLLFSIRKVENFFKLNCLSLVIVGSLIDGERDRQGGGSKPTRFMRLCPWDPWDCA